MKKKFLCLGLAIMISVTQVAPVLADREDDLKREKAATSSQLDSTNSSISNLEQKKAAITGEINQMDAELVDIMVAIDVLNDEITDKEAEIVQTKEELKVAEADRDKQYEDMKLRIQYIYEKGGDIAWAQMLLEAEDISSLLNQAEYTQQLYEYDRTSLENYVSIVTQVVELGDRLDSEKADLEVMKNDYKEQEAALEVALTEKKATSADYANQISNAEAQASQYRELLRQQTAEINSIQAEKQRAAEEARRAAAAEAERKAEAARRTAAQNENNESQSSSNDSQSDNSSNSSNSSSSNESSSNNSSSNESSSNSSSSNESSSNSSSSNESSSNESSGSSSSNESSSNSSSDSGSSSNESSGSGASYSGRGSAVVGYATQFVGNPYVWGGTSLTNGADCSGFIMSVYANFGVSLPHSSGGMRSSGVGVSYSEAMPGDIICYSGHVAIYMGGGSIVHASNAKDGIKISGNAAYRTILAVRRVI